MMPGYSHADDPVVVADYANPLPHVLMLTAIVVGVATLGLALAITQKIFREYGTLEEDDILKQIKPELRD
jgi:multicomponent Na+:H+ antiporter subunit C